jgi:hypothetical protein
MTEGYSFRGPRSPLPEQPCARHKTFTYGVLRCDVLFAYLTLHRAGELAMVSMILGHGAHLENDVMWLLFAGCRRRPGRPGRLVLLQPAQLRPRWSAVFQGAAGFPSLRHRVGDAVSSPDYSQDVKDIIDGLGDSPTPTRSTTR